MSKMRHCILAVLIAGFLSLASSASATSFVSSDLSIDITIDALQSMDLAGFDIEITYDNSLLNFSGYVLTSELGDIEAGEAEDFSYTDQTFVPGVISLRLSSYLDDTQLADQADDFVLVSLYFWGDEEALADVSVTSLDFSAVNIEGTQISFTLANTAQASAVPVPATISLLSMGLVSLIPFARRHKV